MLLATTKICFRCKQKKPVSEFYKSNTRYYQRECKSCTKERRSEWWRSEKGKRSSKNTKLKHKYGITIEQYEELLYACNGKCEICGAAFGKNGNPLSIDHDHETGKIRGLLCDKCNLGVSHFRDNIDLMLAAAQYIEVKGGKNGRRQQGF